MLSAPRYIFVSKPQGISQIPSFQKTVQSARSLLRQLKASNPSHVQVDSGRDQLYWAEKDNESTRIMRIGINQLDQAPDIVYNNYHEDNPYPAEGNV